MGNKRAPFKTTAAVMGRRNLTRIVAVIVFVFAILAAASLNSYFIRDDAGGYVLWNASDAYFFIGEDTRGFHVSWLKYPWFWFKSHIIGGFATAEIPDDDRGSLVVLRVNSSGVERHEIEQLDRRPGSGPDMYTPVENRIYANCPTLHGLCVWSGDHFEQASVEDVRRLDGLNRLTMKTFENQNGWSKRGLDPHFTIDVGDNFELLVNNSAISGIGHGVISIDQQYGRRVATRIFNLDVRQRQVDKGEYQHSFPRRD